MLQNIFISSFISHSLHSSIYSRHVATSPLLIPLPSSLLGGNSQWQVAMGRTNWCFFLLFRHFYAFYYLFIVHTYTHMSSTRDTQNGTKSVYSSVCSSNMMMTLVLIASGRRRQQLSSPFSLHRPSCSVFARCNPMFRSSNTLRRCLIALAVNRNRAHSLFRCHNFILHKIIFQFFFGDLSLHKTCMTPWLEHGTLTRSLSMSYRQDNDGK